MATRKPKMPTHVFSHLGPIPVLIVETVDEHGSRGESSHEKREIKVQSGNELPAAMSILGHELLHTVLTDAGADSLFTMKKDDRLLEFACDAFGTWFSAAVLSGAIVLSTKLPSLSGEK